MNIAGLGILTAHGRGLDATREAAFRGLPVTRQPDAAPEATPFRIPPSLLTGDPVFRGLRRVDRFSRITTLAAADALDDAGLPPEERAKTGIIVATAYGPHATTFTFMDGMMDFGEDAASPILFGHTVHGAAAFYLTRLLGGHGPATTITRFGSSFFEALIVAETWLEEGRCQHILVGAVDELSPVLEYGYRELQAAARGTTQPAPPISANFKPAPGEGSAFFLLSSTRPATYGKITGLERARAAEDLCRGEDCLRLLDLDGSIGDQSVYQRATGGQAKLGCITHIFGGIPSGTALNTAVGGMLLQQPDCFLSCRDALDESVPACSPGNPSRTRSVTVVKYDCDGTCEVIRVERGSTAP